MSRVFAHLALILLLLPGSAFAASSGVDVIVQNGRITNAPAGGQFKLISDGTVNNGIEVLLGYSGNSITAGCIACSILGGGTSTTINTITSSAASYTSIGGGCDNTIGNSIASKIGGGCHNSISQTDGHGTVSGGSTNSCTGAAGFGYCAVGGGSTNSVTSANAGTIAGGFTNAIQGGQSQVIAGGSTNIINANSDYSAIVGGFTNLVSGALADYAVIGGRSNTASAQANLVVGRENTASGDYGSVVGYQGTSTLHGKHTMSSGDFAAAGDAQTAVLVMRRQTTDATATQLKLDGSGVRLAIPTDTTWFVQAQIVARRTDADNESAVYECKGGIDNNAGTTALLAAITPTTVFEDTAAWGVTCTASAGTNSFEVTVTGEAAKTIRWVARVTLVEVTG